MNITTRRVASSHGVAACSLVVYDDYGKARHLSLRLTPADDWSWNWEADLEGVSTPLSLSTGKLTFGTEGKVSGITARYLTFRSGEGEAGLDFRYAFDVAGLARGGASTVALEQDGYPAGTLEKLTFGADGIITGAYTNGKSRSLFHLPLADFSNPGGLRPVGGNSFVESPVSGKAVAPDTGLGALRSGAVEYLTDAEKAKVCEVFPGC